MKKLLFLSFIIFSSQFVFSQSEKFYSFMVESSIGYAVGINIENAAFFDIKLSYPLGRFGFALEAEGYFLLKINIFTPFSAL